jgi:glucose/arabinose dehydrogenase
MRISRITKLTQEPWLLVGNRYPVFAVLLIVSLLLLLPGCATKDKAGGEKKGAEPEVQSAGQRKVNTDDVVVPAGLQIEAVATGLSYPVDVTFDEQGNTYVAEAGGHTYGTMPERAPQARILQLMPDGTTKVLYDKVVPMNIIKGKASSNDIEEGLIPPLTGVTYHDGKLFIAHRSRYSTYDLASGEFKTIINGLPSWGEFLNAKPIFKDGKMYFFLSTQGNSGVIEEHWVKVVDEFNKPNAHEVPGEDVTLTGKNFWVPTDKMKSVDADSVETGAFVALGEKTKPGQVVKGEKICNGAFFSCNPDGSNIQRIAWGLRSSFGYRFSPDGRLITTMNSANPMAPRGLYFDYEPVYEVVQDEWYGWPDYYSGIPITDERFGVKKEDRAFVLTDATHRKLLRGKDKPRQPIARLPVHSAAEGMVFGNRTLGVPEQDILVAEFGVIIPFFKGPAYHPKLPAGVPTAQNAPPGVKYNWPGFKVQQVNLSTGNATDFIHNKNNLPASAKGTGGLERPIQMEWSKEGSLYIVDFGVVEFDDSGMVAHPNTGVVWKVSKSQPAN